MTATQSLPVRRVIRIGRIRMPLRPRILFWYPAMAIGILLLFGVSVSIGEMPIPLGDVAAVLLGGGAEADRFIVTDLRLPRALVALGAGLALGVSGALLQNITRNPLASPDVIGILSGASAGAVAAIVLGATTAIAGGATAFAVLGGLAAAAAVFLLSGRDDAGGMRLILVGIGVTAISAAVTSLLLVSARVHEAAQAVVWLTGTLDGRTWTHAGPLLIAVVVVVPLLAPLLHPLSALALGDDLARSLGVRTSVVRTLGLAAATVLAAAAVAAAGPIAFIAFVAPQIVMRVIASPTPPVIGGGLGGALLLLATDAATRTLLPIPLPVGIVTVALGAPLFLVILRGRRRRLTV